MITMHNVHYLRHNVFISESKFVMDAGHVIFIHFHVHVISRGDCFFGGKTKSPHNLRSRMLAVLFQTHFSWCFPRNKMDLKIRAKYKLVISSLFFSFLGKNN